MRYKQIKHKNKRYNITGKAGDWRVCDVAPDTDILVGITSPHKWSWGINRDGFELLYGEGKSMTACLTSAFEEVKALQIEEAAVQEQADIEADLIRNRNYRDAHVLGLI